MAYKSVWPFYELVYNAACVNIVNGLVVVLMIYNDVVLYLFLFDGVGGLENVLTLSVPLFLSLSLNTHMYTTFVTFTFCPLPLLSFFTFFLSFPPLFGL